jgi:signal transduction histidine kinase
MTEALLNNVAYELRNPLNTILATLPLFSDQVLGPMNEAQLGSMRLLAASARSLSTMVNDMLVMSDLHAGRLQLVMQPVDFPALAAQAIRAIEPLAKAASQCLVDEVDPELPVFMGDAPQLGRVMGHLLGNAVKHASGAGTIRVRATARDGALFVGISDTGAGIEPAELGELFQPFRRISPDRRSGLGIGLAICKALIEAHGGTIGVDSGLGLGSTFWFTLPLHLRGSTRTAI